MCGEHDALVILGNRGSAGSSRFGKLENDCAGLVVLPVLRNFLPDYNRRFARAARDTEKAWRPAPQNLDRIFCFHHQRSVSNDNVVQWDGRRFQIPSQPQRFSFAGAKVQIYESLEGKVAIYYGENKLHYTEGVTFSSGR